jgi:hypothetical protein
MCADRLTVSGCINHIAGPVASHGAIATPKIERQDRQKHLARLGSFDEIWLSGNAQNGL